MEMIVIEIDLSLIPSDKIKNFLRKNGNEANVVKLCACKRKQPDPYGSDITVYINQNAEERLSNQPKIFCGKGVEIKTNKTETQQNNNSRNNNNDDCPF